MSAYVGKRHRRSLSITENHTYPILVKLTWVFAHGFPIHIYFIIRVQTGLTISTRMPSALMMLKNNPALGFIWPFSNFEM